MSPDLERLIGRAVADQKFFNDLKNDPDTTIKNSGLNITQAEIGQIKSIINSINSLENDVQNLTQTQFDDWI